MIEIIKLILEYILVMAVCISIAWCLYQAIKKLYDMWG